MENNNAKTIKDEWKVDPLEGFTLDDVQKTIVDEALGNSESFRTEKPVSMDLENKYSGSFGECDSMIKGLNHELKMEKVTNKRWVKTFESFIMSRINESKGYCNDISSIFDYLKNNVTYVEFTKYDESGYECLIGNYIVKRDDKNDIFTINDKDGEGLTNKGKQLEFKFCNMSSFELPDGRKSTQKVWYETDGCDNVSGAYNSKVGEINMLIKKQK